MIKQIACVLSLLMVTACQSSVPIVPAATPQVAVGNGVTGASIDVRLAMITQFKTAARPMKVSDIDHFIIKLYDSSDTLRFTYNAASTSPGVTFTTVPNGTYYITGEAFDANGSITTGGPQKSSNTVTVASPSVSYSAGNALTASLHLLDGTGEAFGSTVTVSDGDDYTGPITVSP